MKNSDYLKVNKESWNEKVNYHVKSDFYAHDDFMKGKSSLNEIELKILGDVKGKKILHLQCHFGQDTLSLARLGADVTGVDLSDKAIDEARKSNKLLGLDAKFICCDIYDLPNHLSEEFDIVFTSYGVIGWLPDMNKWAKIIDHYLKPAGELLLVEFHPVVWMFDEKFESVDYSYFNKEAIKEEVDGTYADQEAPLKLKYISWNHDLSEVMMALINNGMAINKFEEYDYSPYNCFLAMEKIAERKFQIGKLSNKIPLIYSILAKKEE